MQSTSYESESENSDHNNVPYHDIDRSFNLPPMRHQGLSHTPAHDPMRTQPSFHDGHDWGSQSAAAAVKKLQAMGAQVFPPGSKAEVDWGVLAGESQLCFMLYLYITLVHPITLVLILADA